MNIKIEAVVQFNSGEAYVLDRYPEFRFQKEGSILWANHSGFFKVYHYERPSGRFQAFAGREFDIPMVDGSSIRAKGDWWDAGSGVIAEKLGIELVPVTIGTKKGLQDCYVFSGGILMEKIALERMRSEYDGPVYPYRDYEKVIKFDIMRNKEFKTIYSLEKKCNSILKEARRWKSEYEMLKDGL